MKSRPLFFLWLFLGAAFLPGLIPNAPAQIYKWTDEAGNVRFSDSPPAGVKVQKLQGASGSPQTGIAPAAPAGAPAAEKRNGRKVKVIMYMTDWCGYCRKAREVLKSLDVDLVEYNVEKNPGKRAEFKAKGGQGVPLIDVEGVLIPGYNAESIRSAVEEKRSR
jgi:glutaredoxin